MNASPTSLSRSDRVGMHLTVAICLIAAAFTVFAVVSRLLEVVGGDDVAVLVPFVGETATLPIGPGGAPVEVAVDQAVVTVSEREPTMIAGLVGETLVTGVAALAGIALLCLFCLELARGRAFSASTVRIVFIGTAVLLLGWVLGSVFRSMATTSAVAVVSDGDHLPVLLTTDFAPAFAVLALAAVGTAFQIGHRLQRETEGLV